MGRRGQGGGEGGGDTLNRIFMKGVGLLSLSLSLSPPLSLPLSLSLSQPEGWMKKQYCTYSITLLNKRFVRSFVLSLSLCLCLCLSRSLSSPPPLFFLPDLHCLRSSRSKSNASTISDHSLYLHFVLNTFLFKTTISSLLFLFPTTL